MGLVSLTYTDSGDSFYLDENNIIRVYSQNSETKVQYIDVELGVVKTVTVDETVSVVGGSSNLLIALTETASGSTFYLNSGMISLVTPSASGSLVRFDYNGQQLQIQVDESDVSVLTPSTPATYKIYRALLTQSGTSAPVATVLENTLGGTLVWSYSGVGDYLATLSNAFPLEDKLWVVCATPVNSPGSTYVTYWNDVNSFGLGTGDKDGIAGNDRLYKTSIEVRVYN